MSALNVSSLRFDPLSFDSTLNAHSNGTHTDCNIDNVMTRDCIYFDSDILNQHIVNTNYRGVIRALKNIPLCEASVASARPSRPGVQGPA